MISSLNGGGVGQVITCPAAKIGFLSGRIKIKLLYYSESLDKLQCCSIQSSANPVKLFNGYGARHGSANRIANRLPLTSATHHSLNVKPLH